MSKYEQLLQRARQHRRLAPEPAPVPPEEPGCDPKQAAALAELHGWDPIHHQELPRAGRRREPIYLMDAPGENGYGRRLRMLRQLSYTCSACTMCELGRQPLTRQGSPLELDPHCFSNLKPSRFMVVGQNPGWEELRQGAPFVGPSGDNFNRELEVGGLSRDEFYICNTVRCATPQNQRPGELHRARCAPFLQMELTLLQPLLVVALGAVAFSALCPGEQFEQRLRLITRSERYDVPVFAVYHPSPLNLQEPERLQQFQHQMRLLCRLVQRLKQGAHACLQQSE